MAAPAQILIKLSGKFPGLLDPQESVLEEYSGAMSMMISHAGKIIITQRHFGFASNRGFTNRLLPIQDMRNVKEDKAGIVLFSVVDGTNYTLKNVERSGQLVQLLNRLRGMQSDSLEKITQQLMGGASPMIVRDFPATTAPQDNAPEEDKLAAFYAVYKDEDDDVIGPSGVGRLCEDLGVDPASVDVLLLAWSFEARRMGYFTRVEFVEGCRKLRATCVEDLRRAMARLKKDIENESTFDDLYHFAFQFSREDDQKSVATPMALAMIPLVLGDKYPHVPLFIEFLSGKTQEYKVINNDQWTSLLAFARKTDIDCKNYDDAEWPSIIDEYVEWKEKRKK